ncbi:MAG: mercuric transporter MerT family protein [Burkholderiaceae bacterium]|uniref:mercuric transporter MerT family protein n=1 Tax=Rhodoferax sp. TaxID=50421 RepID=UPI001ED0AC78|nr:mercuric transporter MerT family protein [Rhodoferax sp.]MBT9504996.1 mercury transporter MerT [Rhodoferax sp.]MDO8767730.1 mercuric transporter MerT family protein [Burkholderiaceae bacterium]MDO9236172.1 mercuric transporter MerT family protein [Aquabacterium sp.]
MDIKVKSSMAAAALAAIGASACCAGPLILLSLGIGGAWIGNLTALEPYRPIFVALVAVFMVMAWRRLYRESTCATGDACAIPEVVARQRTIFWVVLAMVCLMAASPWLLPFIF